MTALRIFLFTGLVLHKAVWELLKRQSPAKASNPPLKLRVLKLGKLFFLLFLLIQTLFLDVLPISNDPFLLQVFGISLYVLGLCIAILGRIQLGKNWIDLEDYRVLQEQKLVTRGIYRAIRHPIYAGDLLLIIGLELALNSWLFALFLLLIPLLLRQAMAEESILRQAFPEYEEYCRRTKRFIPYLV